MELLLGASASHALRRISCHCLAGGGPADSAMPSEPLVTPPFLAVGISISGMPREPNVCQPEWKNGPSALCWALTSSPEMAAKQLLEHRVRNDYLCRGHGRGTLVSLIVAHNAEWGPDLLIRLLWLFRQAWIDGTNQEAGCFVVVWPWASHFTFMLCHSKMSSINFRL